MHQRIGRHRISRFLNDLARPHVSSSDLVDGDRAMAADQDREREATEWIEGLVGDAGSMTAIERAVRVQIGLPW